MQEIILNFYKKNHSILR